MAHPLNEPVTERAGDRGPFPGSSPSTTPRPAPQLVRAFFEGSGRIEPLERYGPLVARILISQIFLISGLQKVLDPSEAANEMAGRGMFWISFFLVGAIVFELAGGLSLLLGYKARLGALALFLYLIPVTLTFHNFWTYPEAQQKIQMILFMHNLTLLGGLLLVMSYGPGAFSIDRGRGRSA